MGETDRSRCLVVLLPFSNIVKLFLPVPNYEQQMRIIFEYGGDMMLAEKRDILDSETHVMVADEVYDDKATVGLSDEEPKKALKPFAAVDALLTSDEVFPARYSMC